ncbi:osmoprotectant transport system substrate-binding protein [Glaciihabitans tibetensis]|uniref:Osmoprotectant transport system substrate-binding protein n=1 Tax=Glaciihabitans tibetensis TaxID=1266600 RepID=A0A2T0VJA6_9MICO|nr:ABC transporter substrate-binding protein [Glaciihabitans tibetensis]PRY70185.1 osmoprotectant transport system substrate-binding protein [Glaciihabitans tibetensis]
MFTAGKGRRVAIGAVVVGAVIALSGCASGDPLADENSSSDGETLVVGSQQYYSNEIVAEIYSQALENAGYTIDRQFQIGAREVYLPEVEEGNIDVFPEYTGSLLQALDPSVTSGTSDEVYSQLVEALPEELSVLDPAEASDQNSWTVTQAFADQYDLTDIASLSNVTEPITVGGNSELQTRPYGPDALQELYGVTVAGFTAVEDSGGPLTVKALVDNTIQLTNIYTASPLIEANDLIALEDPDGLFLPDNIVPVVSDKVDADATDILNEISAALSAEDLVSMNAESVDEQKSSEEIATAWLTENDLLG